MDDDDRLREVAVNSTSVTPSSSKQAQSNQTSPFPSAPRTSVSVSFPQAASVSHPQSKCNGLAPELIQMRPVVESEVNGVRI